MKKFLSIFCLTGILGSLLISCASTKQGVYADIIGFNDSVEERYEPYNLDSEKDVKKIKSAIMNLKSGRNTAEYYAVDLALDRIADIVDDADDEAETSYYLILLTDGLDNVSLEMARREKKAKHSSLDEYATYLQNRMKTILNKNKKHNNTTSTFQAYPMMMFGKDMRDSDFSKDECKQILRPLAGGQNASIPEPIVEESFEGILTAFEQTFSKNSFSFEVPKGYVGKRIKMKFNKSDVQWFEADFARETKGRLLKKKEVYSLKNLSFGTGFSIAESNEIAAEVDDDDEKNTVRFTISNIRYNDFPCHINSSEQQYEMGGKFRINSEYKGESKTEKDAYIIFLLDTSSSLGEKEKEAKETAWKIINHIREKL